MAGQRPFSSQPGDDLDLHDWPAVLTKVRQERRKPLIRIVCPVCAGVVFANALDTEGTTESLCSKCDKTIFTVDTDDEGRIAGIQGIDHSKEKKKEQAVNWQYVSGGLAVLLALTWFYLMITSSRLPAASNVAAPANAAAELASPVKSAAPAPSCASFVRPRCRVCN